MSLFEINPSKLLTITSLSDSTFPAIQSTDNKPTPFVSPRTVAYIHGDSTPSSSTLSPRITPTPLTHELFEMRHWLAKSFRS
jgi:hypothetical protein